MRVVDDGDVDIPILPGIKFSNEYENLDAGTALGELTVGGGGVEKLDDVRGLGNNTFASVLVDTVLSSLRPDDVMILVFNAVGLGFTVVNPVKFAVVNFPLGLGSKLLPGGESPVDGTAFDDVICDSTRIFVSPRLFTSFPIPSARVSNFVENFPSRT